MEKESFVHLVLTRINVLRSEWDEEWLFNRIKLFNTFCFPSLRHQTEQNFKWLVFLDEKTPLKIKEELQILSSEWNIFLPIYVADYYGEYLSVIKKLIPNNCKFIITSRI